MIMLASSSPRRHAILTELGLDFEISSPEVVEVHHDSDALRTVVENAKIKLDWCCAHHTNTSIITADTVVIFNGKTLGKPESLSEAQTWFECYSGNSMEVVTAMGYYNGSSTEVYTDTTSLVFKKLTSDIISHYFSLVDPLDKAGAYNIDEHGDLIIESILGSYSNIMGLCKERVTKVLKL